MSAEQKPIISALWREFVSNLAVQLSQSELTSGNIIALATIGLPFAGQNCDGLLTMDASLRLTSVNGTQGHRYLLAGSITGIIEREPQSDSDSQE